MECGNHAAYQNSGFDDGGNRATHGLVFFRRPGSTTYHEPRTTTLMRGLSSCSGSVSAVLFWLLELPPPDGLR